MSQAADQSSERNKTSWSGGGGQAARSDGALGAALTYT